MSRSAYGEQALELATTYHDARRRVWDQYLAYAKTAALLKAVAAHHQRRLEVELQRPYEIAVSDSKDPAVVHQWLSDVDRGCAATYALKAAFTARSRPFSWSPPPHVQETVARDLRLMRRTRDRLFDHNDRLVRFVANKHLRRQYPQSNSLLLSFEDLCQEGYVGLSRAIDKFDPHRNFAFSTYAVTWIRQGMTRALRRSRLVKIPINKTHDVYAPVRSLDSPLVPGETTTFLERLTEDLQLGAFSVDDAAHVHMDLEAAIDVLPDPRDQIMVRARSQGATLQETGDLVGLTRERARQRLVEAVEIMRIVAPDLAEA